MFLIRADGNAKIGAGHLMRCLTIAEELALLLGGKEEIRFVCADGQSAALAGEHGFCCHVLETDYQNMESELPMWQDIFLGMDTAPDNRVILVDSYYVTDDYLTALRQWGYLVLMDDLGTRRYPADCVINYNAPASMEAYRALYSGQDVRLLIGSSFVPIRRQFWDKGVTPGKEVRRVLITTGGGDIDNIAGEILERIYTPEMEFYLVIGQFNPHFQRMKALEQERGNVHICHNVTDMAGLMGSCDIALTAGGSTVYELAALGVPLICFSYAANQEALVEYVERKEIACSAGAWHIDSGRTLDRIGELFAGLVQEEALRRGCHQKERAMADGRGACRLAESLAFFGRTTLEYRGERDKAERGQGRQSLRAGK